jgi:hypothetical protein
MEEAPCIAETPYCTCLLHADIIYPITTMPTEIFELIVNMCGEISKKHIMIIQMPQYIVTFGNSLELQLKNIYVETKEHPTSVYDLNICHSMLTSQLWTGHVMTTYKLRGDFFKVIQNNKNVAQCILNKVHMYRSEAFFDLNYKKLRKFFITDTHLLPIVNKGNYRIDSGLCFPHTTYGRCVSEEVFNTDVKSTSKKKLTEIIKDTNLATPEVKISEVGFGRTNNFVTPEPKEHKKNAYKVEYYHCLECLYVNMIRESQERLRHSTEMTDLCFLLSLRGYTFAYKFKEIPDEMCLCGFKSCNTNYKKKTKFEDNEKLTIEKLIVLKDGNIFSEHKYYIKVINPDYYKLILISVNYLCWLFMSECIC